MSAIERIIIKQHNLTTPKFTYIKNSFGFVEFNKFNFVSNFNFNYDFAEPHIDCTNKHPSFVL